MRRELKGEWHTHGWLLCFISFCCILSHEMCFCQLPFGEWLDFASNVSVNDCHQTIEFISAALFVSGGKGSCCFPSRSCHLAQVFQVEYCLSVACSDTRPVHAAASSLHRETLQCFGQPHMIPATALLTTFSCRKPLSKRLLRPCS